ncbi:DUF4124 domain-containing protein [Cellvibrio sp. PSBB023]|uniref:DUF4124 domain-containing protein n=1 Tax=Cellvibrio sp. PSBB023 TaxID=1945512 RepID=UPI0009902A27|nr:DUF4124 domain-containing protein [Cellvibrio sp. PSBB023]AQT58705.1 hypothetical protein B0D95_00300 [Cellvibrio sp. PSBB023]
MKRLIASALCGGLILATPLHAEINKCKGADGKLHYTDKPCPSATKLESSELSAEDKRKIEREKQDQQQRAEWEASKKELDDYRATQRAERFTHLKTLLDSGKITQLEFITIQQKGIFIGMSELALQESWGKPSSINKSGVGSDQWVYNIGSTAKANYAYVENGKVTNWQTTE